MIPSLESLGQDAVIVPKKPEKPKKPVDRIPNKKETARWLTENQTFTFMKTLNMRLNWRLMRTSVGPVLVYPGKVYEAVEQLNNVGWDKIERQMRAQRFILSRNGHFPIMVWWNGAATEVMAIGLNKSNPNQ